LVGRRERSVGIWRLAEPSSTASNGAKKIGAQEEMGGGGYEKLIDLDFKVSLQQSWLNPTSFEHVDL
jgi:hypothetical protein